MRMGRVTHLRGESGKAYKYYVDRLTDQLKDEPGNFAYARENKDGTFVPLFVGETPSLSQRLMEDRGREDLVIREATHLLVHLGSPVSEERRSEAWDIVQKHRPAHNC
jgi:hypothetical protein